MSQTRLHFIATRPASTGLFAALETEFEDDGLPIAIMELDEDAGTDEISVYADDGTTQEVERRILAIAARHDLSPSLEQEVLPDIDWVTKSLEGLKPVRAGRFLVHGSHDRDRRRTGDIGIEIEAGLAFGTGHHGTTAGCLEVLTQVVRRESPRNALDLGTGSAVLAIALAKMARISVLATDIDAVATAVAKENVRLNAVSAYVETATAAGFQNPVFARRGPFDLIVANILARPLMKLAPQMAAHLLPGGSLVLSGILDRQRDAVVAAYAGQRFRHVRTLHREGWVTIHLKR
ncbi:50S ribosomal protein L11 methyltransferase [Mesorhizobium microcysteis]|uniref:Ribosomal protein L11 methyltransferase n=1 Tax=Neoaquamicrobium microcysteis TaxID=2682781 RepID=A0A5D4GWP6_9HYPH|nr:50S ribosomal protein L11 methyltransferase [Mesorhizobium microcysteis]TYR32393.1 50S ribosomal protein L11 methyltransferase [Mesorhizobium microcysteis]